jgi:hypothetical protein
VHGLDAERQVMVVQCSPVISPQFKVIHLLKEILHQAMEVEWHQLVIHSFILAMAPSFEIIQQIFMVVVSMLVEKVSH